MSDEIELPEGLPEGAYDLGEPTDAFGIGPGRAAVLIVVGLFGLLAALALVISPVLLLIWGGRAVNGAMLGKGAIAIIALAGWTGVQGLNLLLRGVRDRGACVLAFRDGLVYLHDQDEVIRWDDVAMLEQGRTSWNFRKMVGSFRYYKVRRRSDGREFVFDSSLPRYRELGRLIEDGTLQPLLTPALARIEAGEAVAFGPLALGPEGIWRGDAWLPWDQVASVTEEIVIEAQEVKRKPWHKRPVDEVPNYHVFLEIVRGRLAQ